MLCFFVIVRILFLCELQVIWNVCIQRRMSCLASSDDLNSAGFNEEVQKFILKMVSTHSRYTCNIVAENKSNSLNTITVVSRTLPINLIAQSEHSQISFFRLVTQGYLVLLAISNSHTHKTN